MNNTLFKFPLFVTLLFSLFLVSCEEDPTRIDFSDVPDPFSIEGAEKVETESGLIYYVIEEGSGEFETNPRDQIRIFYTKRLERNKKRVISSSYANGVTTPVSTGISNSRIVTEQGFKEGLIGMKEGEKRVLVLSPDLAYGDNPNSNYTEETIWIDVELDSIIL